MTDHLQERIEDGVAVVTMNRPDSLNAMSDEMMEAMAESFSRLSEDDDVGCVVLTGAGRGFCAGGDVKAMASGGDGAASSLEAKVRKLRRAMEASRLLHEMPKPTIAMVRGPAAGAGLSLALACDMRIASETLKMTTAFVNVAFSGDFGGSWYLTQMVGTAKARELYYTADIVLADEALRLGLVNRVHSDDELEEKTMALAKKFASGPRITLAYIKRNMNAAETGTYHDQLDLEALHHSRCGMTEDHKEATAAFVEKRAAVFKGR